MLLRKQNKIKKCMKCKKKFVNYLRICVINNEEERN